VANRLGLVHLSHCASAAGTAGFRLVVEVRDHDVLVLVVALGKRQRNAVYRQADQR
jgi:hypothetical protein